MLQIHNAALPKTNCEEKLKFRYSNGHLHSTNHSRHGRLANQSTVARYKEGFIETESPNKPFSDSDKRADASVYIII